jgi:serine/threonine protein kinase
MKKLNSDNIIKFYDIIESKSYYYIFMEHADGGTLREVMKSKKFFNQDQAVRMMEQILNGFREIVKFGVIHRYHFYNLVTSSQKTSSSRKTF